MSSAPTPDANAYPLLIKQLLLMPLAVSPEQEIVYGCLLYTSDAADE